MKIQICSGNTCAQKFSKYIKKRLDSDVEKNNLKNISVEYSACMGRCKKAINVKIDDEIYSNSNPIKISELMFKKLKNEKKNK